MLAIQKIVFFLIIFSAVVRNNIYSTFSANLYSIFSTNTPKQQRAIKILCSMSNYTFRTLYSAYPCIRVCAYTYRYSMYYVQVHIYQSVNKCVFKQVCILLGKFTQEYMRVFTYIFFYICIYLIIVIYKFSLHSRKIQQRKIHFRAISQNLGWFSINFVIHEVIRNRFCECSEAAQGFFPSVSSEMSCNLGN